MLTRPHILMAAAIGARTGGPEASHQLVATVRELGWDASLFPMRGYEGASPEPEYAAYECEVVQSVPDRGRYHVLIPEVWPTAAARFRRHRMSVWWLSVDNSPLHVARKWVEASQPIIGAVTENSAPRSEQELSLRQRTRLTGRDVARRGKLLVAEKSVLGSRVSHMAQSAYSTAFCTQALRRDSSLVSDYLRPFDTSASWRGGDGTVWFNGAKGGALVETLRSLAPDVDFRPIVGMSYAEVLDSLSRGSAYLEVGHLPGRDRLPREAARLGLPVLVLGRGAGQFEQDFPHLGSHRIFVGPDWGQELVAKLRFVLDDPIAASESQSEFQSWVLGDRDRFRAEVSDWLGLVERLHEAS
jgi:hypothetical protein